MAQNVYEGMFILDSNRYARDAQKVASSIPKAVEAVGGEILASRLWSEQKLAYPINGHRKGTYWLSYFRVDSDKLTELNRSFKLNEGILRSLLLKIDPRLVDAMVQHAVAGTVPKPVSDDAAKSAKAADDDDDDDDDEDSED